MEEVTRLNAERYSWRGSYDDLRADVAFVAEIVRRRAPNEEPTVSLEVTIGSRERKYEDEDEFRADLKAVPIAELTRVDVWISNNIVRVWLQLRRGHGAAAAVTGPAVDAEGVRTEVDRQLGRRESLPRWGYFALWPGATVAAVVSLVGAEISLLAGGKAEDLRLVICLGLALVGVTAWGVATRSYPRLEFVQTGESRGAVPRKRLLVMPSYLATAVLAALAAHYPG